MVSHLPPDRLALFAVGDDAGDHTETTHLATCDACEVELAALRRIASHAARAHEVRDLPAPPERVWHAIRTAVGMGSDRTGKPDHEPGTPPANRRRRRRPELARLVLAASAAAVLATGATVGVGEWRDRGSAPLPAVTAQAVLAQFTPGHAGSAGHARVLDGRVLHLHVPDLAPSAGYYEVWLIDPDTMRMISLGVVGDDPDVLLPLPPTVDLSIFRLVDVSVEQYGDPPDHSGVSALRGELAQSADS